MLDIFENYEKQKYISLKQTLTGFRQKLCIRSGRGFIKSALYKYFICRALSYKSYSYPMVSIPLPNLRLNYTRPFYVFEIDNFGPLYVSNMWPSARAVYYTQTFV